MKRFTVYFMLLFAAIAFEASAQMITYSVTVPVGTKACYIAGEMNGWLQQVMTKVDETHYSISFSSNNINAGYKYCSGPGWAFVEKDSAGAEIVNRMYSPVDVVQKWARVYDPNGDNTAPSAPTGLKFTPPIDNAFYLSWQAATDNVAVVGYDVYKDSVFYGNSITQGLNITGLTPGKTYKMTVRARDAAGNQSIDSSPLLVTNPGSLGITYNVTVPAGTKTCYLVGSMNAWTPSANPMTKVDNTHYSLTLSTALLTDNYKYCSGPDWAYVEKNPAGADINDRTYTTADVVAAWGAVYDPSTLPIEKDVTINVTVPDSVKTCYLVGSFNTWAAPNDTTRMTKGTPANGFVMFSKTIHTKDANTLQFKFCAGPTWEYVQTMEPNFIYPALEPSVTVTVNSFYRIYDPAKTGRIKITATVPAGTNKVWIIGNFINWDLAKAVEGIRNPTGTFEFSIPNIMQVQYRLFNKPDWGYSEIDVTGNDRVNRTAVFPADSITNITVLGWKQLVVDSIPDLVAPGAPTGLKNTTPTTNSFYLSWNASTDNVAVTGYEVYKDSVLYGSTTTLGMDINGLTPGKTYKMIVMAKDAAGNLSGASVVLMVTTQPVISNEVIFNVKVPVGTYQCWITGNYNGWSNNLNQMTRVDSTHYTITLNESTFVSGITRDSLKYKYCSGGGNWIYVEKDSVGGEIPDRRYQANDVVAKWNVVYNPNDIPLPMDLTVKVTTPAGTNECYIVGNFNNWAGPTDPGCKMTKVSTNPDGTVVFTITGHTDDANKFVYHFCSGPDWAYEQKAPIGDFKYPLVDAVVTVWKALYIPVDPNLNNLLLNPGFENWTAGVPKDWTLTTTVGGSVTPYPTMSGTALQIADPTGTYILSQNVVPPLNATTFDTNKKYRLSISYLATAGDGTDARIWSGLLTNAVGTTAVYYAVPPTHADSMLYYIPLHGPGGNLNPPTGVSGNDMNGYLLDNRASQTWHTYTYEMKFPAGITQFQFMVRSYRASTVLWDNFYFGEVQDSIRDIVTPTVPTGLKNTPPTSYSFYLSWNASTDNVGVTGYDVYKDNVFYGSTSVLGMDISGLTPNTTYNMTVKAKDAAGNLSGASMALMVTTLQNISNVVTFNVKVPVGTNQCWIVGNFNNWNNNLNQMTRVDSTHYTITLSESTFAPGITKDSLQYKYCSGGGDWIYVEKDSVGGEIQNRRYHANDVVAKWNAVYDASKSGTIHITATVPAGTKNVWIQGSYLGWDMTRAVPGLKNPDGTFSFTVPNVVSIEYRLYNKPDWGFPEVGQANPTMELPNRSASYPVDSITHINVWGWKQLVDSTTVTGITLQIGLGGNIKENNVLLMSNDFLYVNPGTTKTFTIIPNPGYELETLLFNGQDVKSQCTNNQFTTQAINDKVTLSVSFKKIQYRLSIKSAESGTVSLLCEYGATPSFEFIPTVNWRINSVIFNGMDVTNYISNGIFMVPPVTSDVLLNISFEFQTQLFNAQSNSSVKVYPNNSGIVIEGAPIGEIIRLYSESGAQLKILKSQGDRMIIPAQPDAIYLVKIATKTVKVIL